MDQPGDECAWSVRTLAARELLLPAGRVAPLLRTTASHDAGKVSSPEI